MAKSHYMGNRESECATHYTTAPHSDTPLLVPLCQLCPLERVGQRSVYWRYGIQTYVHSHNVLCQLIT